MWRGYYDCGLDLFVQVRLANCVQRCFVPGALAPMVFRCGAIFPHGSFDYHVDALVRVFRKAKGLYASAANVACILWFAKCVYLLRFSMIRRRTCRAVPVQVFSGFTSSF